MSDQIESNGHQIEQNQKRVPSSSLIPARVLDATKVARAIHLCAAGYDMVTIADEVGFTGPRQAKTAIYDGLKEMQFEAVDEYKQAELNRLDRITRRLFTIIEPYLANGGDPNEYPVDNQAMNAMALYLKVSERRAKYTGMETTRVEVTGGGSDAEPIKVQIVEDVERFQRFIAERVLEMQNNAPQMIAAEMVSDDQISNLDQTGDGDDFNLAQLRGDQRADRADRGSEPAIDRSDEGDSGRMGARRWSDTPRSAGGGGAIIDTPVLPSDPVREAG